MKELPPVTCSLGVIGPLLGKLYSLVDWNPKGVCQRRFGRDVIQSLIQDFEETRNALTELSKEDDSSFTAKCLMKEMREICYDTEDYLDTVLHRSVDDRPEEEEVSDLRARLQGARKRRERCQKILGLKAPLQQDAGERNQRCQFLLDGFQNITSTLQISPHEVLARPMSELIDLLALDSEQQLKVVPIFGPAGVGKTTLARMFYHLYGGRFQCRASLRVSRNPDTRRLLTSMLAQIKGPRPDASCCGVQNISNEVNKHLQGKSYLIIVDDLWDTSAWDIISRAFPDDDHYSRIIITTQIENVALACCCYCSNNNMYEMRPSFDGQPQELFYGSTEVMKEVLNLIYSNLPDHLKTCLLYLNMFPEDYVVFKEDLVKQWVAEGFIGTVKGKDSEEVALSYFDELVARGMIQPVETKYNKEVLSCTVHHMLLDLIACKSMEENFITVVEYFETATGLPDKVHRLSLKFGGARNAQIPGSLRTSHVRSFMFSGFFRCIPSIAKYKLLRVLILDIWADADHDKMSFDLATIRDLFHLRYLKIQCNITVKLPTEMKNLQFLETLEVDATVDAVPPDIVHLHRLLHLCLPSGTVLPQGIAQMINLRSLGYFDLSCNLDKNVLNLGKLTNLQDLRLTCSTAPPSHLFVNNLVEFRSSFARLINLKSLTLVAGFCHGSSIENTSSSTSISCDGLKVVLSPPELLQKLVLFPKNCIFSGLPKWIKRLDKLCTLKIAVKEVLPSHMDVLKELLALTTLSLHVRVAPSNSIVIGQEGFQVLRSLTFRCASVCLSFRKGAMPNVERLKLGFCIDEDGLSSCRNAGLDNLPSLKQISAKVWPAAGGASDDVNRISLKAAISNSVTGSPPIVNIKYVDRIAYGEKYQRHGVMVYRKMMARHLLYPRLSFEEEIIAKAEEVIRSYNNSSSSSSSSMTDYLYAVDDAIAAASHSARAAAAVHAAMPRLEEEVRSLLSSSVQPHLWLSSDDVVDEATPSVVSRRHGTLSPYARASVRGVVDRMLRAGHGTEVAQVYVSVRCEALLESVELLGVQEELDQKMRLWSHALRAMVRTFLAAERLLCDEVFESDQELGQQCFADIATSCVLPLLDLADADTMSARVPDKLFHTLSMFDALTDVQQDLQAIQEIQESACKTIERLGATVRETIQKFTQAIQSEASRKAVRGGDIHPMTRYVVNYCVLLADHHGTLDAILNETSSTDGSAASTPSARCLCELLTLLLHKMDDKSKLYDDAGLQNIFLMNNLYYMVHKVRGSPALSELLGDDWLRQQHSQIRKYETAYLRASWMPLLSTHLRRDGDAVEPRTPQGPSATGFNAAFQELYQAQTTWKVADHQLREELRIAVSELLIPAYRAFLDQGSPYPARHVKCSVKDLENYMLDLFEGVQKFVRW